MNAVVQPIFTPGLDSMRQHVEHLFGGYLDGCHDGLIELAWTDTKPDDSGRYRLKNAKLFGTDRLDELIEEAARLNATPMCNVYIGAALRHPNTAPFGRTNDRDAWALTCAYADLDDPGSATAAKDIYGPDKPTMVIVTGREPHVRAQMWWRLEEPCKDQAQWPILLRSVATKLAGDSSVTNPARVMRLAGTIAWPVKPGRTVELTSITRLREPGRSCYSVDYLAKVFPPPEAPRPPVVAQPTHSLLSALAVKKGEFFRRVNEIALKDASVWVPAIFGSDATFQQGTGAWRVSSKALGRNLEEDLSIATNGIVDFGIADLGDSRQGKRTPIDLIIEYGGAPDAKEAAHYLCELLAVEPTSLGWQDNSTPSKNHQTTTPPAANEEKIDDDTGPFRASSLVGTPPEREWIVPEWIPAQTVTSIYGDGGVGKTLLAQQLIYASAVGGKWLGLDVPKSIALGLFCEDDKDELHRRHDSIKQSMGITIGNPFDDAWLWPRVGFDNLLVTFDRDSRPSMSPLFERTMKAVLDNKIGLLALDTAADLFGGNEIIRGQVNFFIKAVCGSYVRKAKEMGFSLTVVILAHPSQAGKNSGSGESGSTGWSNAVRFRLYLTKPEDGLPEQRILTRKKSNYSAAGDDVKLELMWFKGAIVRQSDAEKADDTVAIKSAIYQILRKVHEAFERGQPYGANSGYENFIGKRVVAEMPHVERRIIGAALDQIRKDQSLVTAKTSSGDRRGYRLSDDVKEELGL